MSTPPTDLDRRRVRSRKRWGQEPGAGEEARCAGEAGDFRKAVRQHDRPERQAQDEKSEIGVDRNNATHAGSCREEGEVDETNEMFTPAPLGRQPVARVADSPTFDVPYETHVPRARVGQLPHV